MLLILKNPQKKSRYFSSGLSCETLTNDSRSADATEDWLVTGLAASDAMISGLNVAAIAAELTAALAFSSGSGSFCSRSFFRKYLHVMNVSHDSLAASHPPSGDENIQWSGGHDGKERWYAGVHQGHCQTRHHGSIGTNVCLLCGMFCLL